MPISNWVAKLSLVIGLTTSITVLNMNLVSAVTLVTNNVLKPPAGQETPVAGVCPPWCGNGTVVTLFSDFPPPRTVINNTPFNISGVIDIIPDDEDAIWGGAFSDYFKKLEISPDGKKLTQSQGVIPPGGLVYPFRITDPPGKKVRFEAELIFTSVPENSATLSLLGLGALGFVSMIKRKQKMKIH
jgi:hypothetical protein